MSTDNDKVVSVAEHRDKNTELDRLLVEGDLVADADGNETRVYPMSTEIAQRLGVSPSWVSKYAKMNRCFERRAELRNKIQTLAHDELARHEAKRVAFDTEKTLRLVDKVLDKYEKAIDKHDVGRVTSADINTMIRLRRYLEGDADTRQEVTGGLTLEAIQGAHQQMLVDLQRMTPAECGMDDSQPRRKALARPFEQGDSDGE